MIINNVATFNEAIIQFIDYLTMNREEVKTINNNSFLVQYKYGLDSLPVSISLSLMMESEIQLQASNNVN